MLPKVFMLLLLAAASPALGNAVECPNPGTQLRVKSETQKIFSPGYPSPYHNSQECLWYLTSEQPSDSSYIIQIATLMMDVDGEEGDCKTDYVEAIGGTDPDSGPILAKWCGNEKKVIKFSGATMIIKFTTDRDSVGKGFILSYNLVQASTSPATCRARSPTQLNIIDGPLYEVFRGMEGVHECHWIIETRQSDRLVIEMVDPSDTMGSDTKMTLYEDNREPGKTSFEWNPRETLFSKIYMSTYKATLVLTGSTGKDENRKGVMLKFSLMDPIWDLSKGDCTSMYKPATLDFHGAPILFSMPFMSKRRESCAVSLRNLDNKNIRLDVLAIAKAQLTCENEPINVFGSNSSNLQRLCSRGRTPVYFHNGDEMTFEMGYEHTTFLMASAMDNVCNGFIQELTAYTNMIHTEMFPKADEYTNMAKCRIRLTAAKREDGVAAKITWGIPDEQNPALYSSGRYCDGDFLNVYDGSSESARLLYSSCHQVDRPGRNVDANVISNRGSLFIELDADKAHVARPMKIEFHALPGAAHCNGPMEVMVGNGTEMVNSPNYPGQYPLNQECDYIFRSVDPRPREDIVIRVINAKLPVSCEDILIVYKGEDMKDDDVVDRVCGNDEGKVIRVQSALASMRFTSNEAMSDEGWSVEVSIEERNAAGMARMGWQCIVGVLVFVLTYFSRH